MTITNAEPTDQEIDAKLSTCKHCNMPIASMMGSPWLHGHSGQDVCTPDPRTEPPPDTDN